MVTQPGDVSWGALLRKEGARVRGALVQGGGGECLADVLLSQRASYSYRPTYVNARERTVIIMAARQLSCWAQSILIFADIDSFLPCDAMRCTVLVTVILSVRQSVCLSVRLHTRGLCPHGSTYDHDFFTIW